MPSTNPRTYDATPSRKVAFLGLGVMGSGFLAMAAANGAAHPNIVLVLFSCAMAGVGLALTNWAAWQAASLAGIFLADAVPVHWGFGFAGTLALLGVGLSLVSDRATSVAAGVAAGEESCSH